MKGSRSIHEQPFRFGGFNHDYSMDCDQWAKQGKFFQKCYCCGGMMRNVRSPRGTLLKKTYPYIATFKVTKGVNKGKFHFRIICRACAYNYGLGVIEKDGEVYTEMNQFKE